MGQHNSIGEMRRSCKNTSADAAKDPQIPVRLVKKHFRLVWNVRLASVFE